MAQGPWQAPIGYAVAYPTGSGYAAGAAYQPAGIRPAAPTERGPGGRSQMAQEPALPNVSAVEVSGEGKVRETVVSPRTLGPAHRWRRAWSRRCGAIGTMARRE
jgi:hypothetical protein